MRTANEDDMSENSRRAGARKSQSAEFVARKLAAQAQKRRNESAGIQRSPGGISAENVAPGVEGAS